MFAIYDICVVQKDPHDINCKIQKEILCLKRHFLDTIFVICRAPYDKWFKIITIFLRLFYALLRRS